MRSFFSPADGPSWLGQVLASIRAALGDLWDKPFGLWQVATTDLPAAADYKGRLVWNITDVRVSYSDGSAWQELQPYDATLAALANYNTNGILVQTAADTFVGRSLTAPAAGLAIANPAGTAGNPTFALANDLAALEALAGTNTIYYRSGVDIWSAVTIGGTLSFAGGTLGVAGAAVTKVDDANVTLTLGGSASTGAVNAFALTLGWTGQLAVGRGGTGIASYAVGDIVYASAASTLAKLAAVATGNVLISGGVTTAPAWGKVDLTLHVTGRLPFANLAQGSALSVLGVTGNATADNASIAAASDGQVLRRSGTAVAFGAVSLSTAAAITGTLPVTNGGTGTTTSTGSGNAVLSASPTFTGSPVLPSPSATALTLINSITNVGGAYATAGYRKYADGRVAVEGFLLGGGGVSPVQVTTMPVGARPPANQTFPCVIYNAGTIIAGMFEVQATGGVFWYSSNTSANFSISGINFQT